MTRIYLPYCVAGLVAVLAMLALRPAPLPDVGITFDEMWPSPTTWQNVLAHLLLFGTPEANAINTPSWSLVYELRISLLVPFLCFWAAKSPRSLAAATCVAYLACDAVLALGPGLTPYAATGLFSNIVVTMHFAADFVLGILLAKAALARSLWLFEMSVGRRSALAVAAAALLLVFRDATAAMGSAIVLVLALNSPPVQNVLRRPLLMRLGRLSFSLYLTHMIVLQLVVRTLHGLVPLHGSILLALLAIAPVTLLFHRWVEAPAARWSRQIGRPRAAMRIGVAAA